MAVGAAPRYFAAADLPKPPPLAALTRWSKALAKEARTADHPFNAGLMLEGACRPGAKHPTLQTTNAFLTMSTPSNAPRPSVMQLAIKEKGALYAAYIPFFVEGGIFVPPSATTSWATTVYVLLTLPKIPSATRWRGAWRGLPQRVRPVIAPRGWASSFQRRKNPACLSSRSKKSWELPWARSVLPRPFDGAVAPCADPRWLVGFFILMPHVY